MFFFFSLSSFAPFHLSGQDADNRRSVEEGFLDLNISFRACFSEDRETTVIGNTWLCRLGGDAFGSQRRPINNPALNHNNGQDLIAISTLVASRTYRPMHTLVRATTPMSYLLLLHVSISWHICLRHLSNDLCRVQKPPSMHPRRFGFVSKYPAAEPRCPNCLFQRQRGRTQFTPAALLRPLLSAWTFS